MTVIRARCFSVWLNVKSSGKKAGLLRVAVVCQVSSATVSPSSQAGSSRVSLQYTVTLLLSALPTVALIVLGAPISINFHRIIL